MSAAGEKPTQMNFPFAIKITPMQLLHVQSKHKQAFQRLDSEKGTFAPN
jgi:hypothetical protein